MKSTKDWGHNKDPKLTKALEVAEKLGLPSPPQLLYCQSSPVFDLIPLKIRRLVNPKASLISCSASLFRNLTGFGAEQPLEVEHILRTALQNKEVMGDISGEYLSISQPGEREAGRLRTVLDTSLARKGLQLGDAQGQGVFVGSGGNLLVWVNSGNHLCLEAFSEGQDLKYVLLRLQKAITKIEESLKVCGVSGFASQEGSFVHGNSRLGRAGFQVSFCLPLLGFGKVEQGRRELDKFQEEEGAEVTFQHSSNFLVVFGQSETDGELKIVTSAVEERSGATVEDWSKPHGLIYILAVF